MFDRFTDNAKRAMSEARAAAIRLGHDYIGTEHLLLGVCAHAAVVHAILGELRVDPHVVAAAVDKVVKRGTATVPDPIPFTPRAKKVLELALKNAHELRDSYLGTEHLLLGLLEEGNGIAAAVLTNLGAAKPAMLAAVAKVRREPPA